MSAGPPFFLCQFDYALLGAHFQIDSVADIAVGLGAVSTARAYPKMLRNSYLRAALELSQSLPRETEHIHEVIAQVYPVAFEEGIVEEIDIEIDIVTENDIISDEFTEVTYSPVSYTHLTLPTKA